jgi:hypothetical protein
MVTGSGAYRGPARYRQRRLHAAAATGRGAAAVAMPRPGQATRLARTVS